MKENHYAEEKPLALWVNQSHLASFLCTPENLEELALGHLITRGMLAANAPIDSVKYDAENGRIIVSTQAELQKEFYSVPSFVICGNSTISNFSEAIDTISPLEANFRANLSDIISLADTMVNTAPIYARSGGVHAAALLSEGKILLREDIGRHSAVDKVIGAGVMEGIDFKKSVLATTGRISLDMLLKSMSVRVPVVASLKVMSSLAAELAEKLQITVVSHVLGQSPIVETVTERILK